MEHLPLHTPYNAKLNINGDAIVEYAGIESKKLI